MTIHAVRPEPDPATTAASIAVTPPVHTPPFTLGKIDQTENAHRAEFIAAVGLVGLVACSDVILIASTWNSVLLQDASVSWTLAILTALGAAGLMWTAGHHTVIATVHRFRGHALLAGACVAVWAVVGAGITWLRWNSAALTSTAVATEGQASNSQEAGIHTHHILAIVLITLYLLPGILAFVDGYKLNNPIAAYQRQTFAELNALRQRVVRLTARRDELQELLTRHDDELAHIDDAADTAKHAANGLANELRAHARTEMVRWLSDPANAGMAKPPTAPPETDPQ